MNCYEMEDMIDVVVVDAETETSIFIKAIEASEEALDKFYDTLEIDGYVIVGDSYYEGSAYVMVWRAK